MKKALTTTKKNYLQTIVKTDTSSLIKPLIKEILLQELRIEDTLSASKVILNKLKLGDELVLKRDLDNELDKHAVRIETSKGKFIGNIPLYYSEIYANLLDAGKLIIGKVKKISNKKIPYKILISLYLRDF